MAVALKIVLTGTEAALWIRCGRCGGSVRLRSFPLPLWARGALAAFQGEHPIEVPGFYFCAGPDDNLTELLLPEPTKETEP